MIGPSLRIASKDLRLVLARGTGLVQALLLGLILIFVFSLSRQKGAVISPQSAATIFILASMFCQVLVFNMLFSLEETTGARFALLLAPMPPQAVWLGKALAGLALLLTAQAVFIPATIVFLNQNVQGSVLLGLGALAALDVGLVALGSLLGALAQGQAARESLLSVILFPLLIPALLAAVRVGTAVFAGEIEEGTASWLGVLCAFAAMFSGAALLLFPFVYSGEE